MASCSETLTAKFGVFHFNISSLNHVNALALLIQWRGAVQVGGDQRLQKVKAAQDKLNPLQELNICLVTVTRTGFHFMLSVFLFLIPFFYSVDESEIHLCDSCSTDLFLLPLANSIKCNLESVSSNQHTISVMKLTILWHSGMFNRLLGIVLDVLMLILEIFYSMFKIFTVKCAET